MFKVYVTRDTVQSNFVSVIPANVGIVKVDGCVIYWPAVKADNGRYGGVFCEVGARNISLSTCRRRYSGVPKQGEAWLIEEGREYINWTRVDEELYRVNIKGNIIE